MTLVGGKYGNKKTVIDGIPFSSKAEARRYEELKLMQKAKVITDLELQPRYDIIVNDHKCGFYKADFRYTDRETGKVVVEDVKGVKTAVYCLKKRLVKAIYGFDVVEIK